MWGLKSEWSRKVGGEMYDLNLTKVNKILCDSIRLVAAIRRMVGPNSDIKDELMDMNRELREAAAECQRVAKLIKEDVERPLMIR